MKKLLPFLLALLIAFPVFGADTKTTALTEDTAPTSDDLVTTVNDPASAKADRKVTIGNLTKGLTLANFPASANVVTMLGSANNAAILSNIGAQASLGLVAGTLTNTYLCTYTSSGTLLSCNTNPANFQAALTYPVTGVASPSAGYLMKWGASGNTAVDGLKFGTMTDTKYCTYSTANGLVCNSTISGGGDLLANGTVPLTANWDVGAYTITAAGFTAAKTSGVAGQSCVYTSSTTDLFGICEEGPDDHRTAHLLMKWPDGSPAGSFRLYGTPSAGRSTSSWVTPGTGVATALAVNVGSAGAVVVNGGALGTPSGGTLTNATGLPIAGLTASTSTALGVGSIELGHASDTTLSRSAGGVMAVEGKVVPRIIVSGTKVLATSSISSGACTAAQDAGTATGVATTDIIDWGFNADPTGITGFGPSATGGLFIYAYPTADHISFKVCNNTAGAITPGAMTLNWRVTR